MLIHSLKIDLVFYMYHPLHHKPQLGYREEGIRMSPIKSTTKHNCGENDQILKITRT